MGSMSVLSCRCCMFVYCVHPVAVLNADELQFANVSQGCKRRPYGRDIIQIQATYKCFLLFTPSSCCKCFYHFVVACVCCM